MKKCLVLGAAGFLGNHLEHRLKAEGHYVVSVARKPPPYRKSVADEYNILDLENVADFHSHFFRHRFDEVYQMAGVVGGLGYIGTGKHDAEILTSSLKINLYTLEAIRKFGNVGKIFFASSQCVYPNKFEIDPFANERLVPRFSPSVFNETQADFFDNFAFAKEKLYAEALYDSFGRAYGLDVRIGRLGNTYGPYCTWAGERSKSVAAICRKVAEASYAGIVPLWGDGQQTRSFTYVDDIVEGIIRLMQVEYWKPLNLASSETASIAWLFELICRQAGKILAWEPSSGPVGASHRGSDNTLCKHVLGWEPPTTLAEGLAKTYPWIAEQVEKSLATPEKVT